MSEMRGSISGHPGLQVQQQITPVCVKDQGSSSTGIRCSGNSMDSVQVYICISSSVDSSLMASQNRGKKEISDSHFTRLAEKNVIHRHAQTSRR